LILTTTILSSPKMPQLNQVRYSREVCVTAVRDYYNFLMKMYPSDSEVIEPPEGGWPSITAENLAGMNKTNKVITLLRELPYIRETSDPVNQAQGAPWCIFADWQSAASLVASGRSESEDFKIVSEGADICDDVPSHVVGLTMGEAENPIFLLDTKLGIVYWHECPGEIRYRDWPEQIEDDPYEWAPENEAEWRGDAPAWKIVDFFQLLKNEFLKLNAIPTNSLEVIDVYAGPAPGTDGMIAMLQDIYREHGWPDLERYRKRECLEAVQKAMRERYPDYHGLS
jgi:hypothetical protein